MKFYPLLLIILMPIWGYCQTKLDRKMAEKIFLEYHSKIWVEYEQIDPPHFSQEQVFILKQMNLLGQGGRAAGYNQNAGGFFSFSKLGDKYIATQRQDDAVCSVIVGCAEFSAITGIKENDQQKNAIVEYSWKRTSVTPFGQYLGLKKGDDGNVVYKIKFELYDDGWRVASEEDKGTKPEKYSFFAQNGDFITSQGSGNLQSVKTGTGLTPEQIAKRESDKINSLTPLGDAYQKVLEVYKADEIKAEGITNGAKKSEWTDEQKAQIKALKLDHKKNLEAAMGKDLYARYEIAKKAGAAPSKNENGGSHPANEE